MDNRFEFNQAVKGNPKRQPQQYVNDKLANTLHSKALLA